MTCPLYDALIIGAGPAGLTAALALGRVRRTALVFDSSRFRNEGVTAMHAVPSRDGAHPAEFRGITRNQIASKYSHVVSFRQTNIINAARAEVGSEGYIGFEVLDSGGQRFRGRKLVLATGSEDLLPEIEGYKENWPEHIYQCLFCDGFEQSGHPIGILGFPSPVYLHLALMAFQFDARVTVFSNGTLPTDAAAREAFDTAVARGVNCDARRVTRLINNGEGAEHGITLEFADGPSVTLGMLLHKPPTANRAQNLFEQLGLNTMPVIAGGEVVVDQLFGQSSVEGCFVAGDTSQMLKAVTIAMAAGYRAAAGVSYQLCSEEGAKAVAAQHRKNQLEMSSN